MIGRDTNSLVSLGMKTIYFAQMPNGGPIKIGTTQLPDQRLGSLRTRYGMPLRFIATVPGRRVDEGILHKIFAEDRIVDEWFRASLKLTAFVEVVQKTGEIPAPYLWEKPIVKSTGVRHKHKPEGHPKMRATLAAKYAIIGPKRMLERAAILQQLAEAA